MKLSIVLAIVISLVVWALTFDSFFDSSRLVLSVVIALAAGLVVVAIFKALTKPDSHPPSIGIQLIIVALAGVAALYALSKIVPTRSCPPEPITLSCEPADANPNKQCIDPGSDVEWITSGIPNGFTVEVHDFKRKRWPLPPKKESPFVSDPPPGNNGPPIIGKLRQDRRGNYKYSVTCTKEGGQPDTKDPMIEIPR